MVRKNSILFVESNYLRSGSLNYMKTINLVSIHPNPWHRQFPKNIPEWDGWRFIFNANDQDYDYLVVFDKISAPITISCNPQNVIHLATEPNIRRHYSGEYLNQFAWTIRQGNQGQGEQGAIFHQPGLNWHVGWMPHKNNFDKILDFGQIMDLFNQPKTKLISIISSKITSTPQHQERLKFARKLKSHFGNKIDFYGRGIVTMDDKLEALRDYRFHVVLESCSRKHYFSEKLSDCILAGAFPIYYGCPNLDEYFDQNAYRRIDIQNFEDSVNIITNATNGQLDRKCRSALLEARDLILYKHNLFPMLINLIQGIEAGRYGLPNSTANNQNLVLMPSNVAKKASSIHAVLSRLTDMVWRVKQ